MAKNLAQSGGLYASEKVMLALVQTGLSRRAAYERVQGHALRQSQANHDSGGDATGDPPFLQRLAADPEITTRLSIEKLRACFDLSHHLRHIDAIIDRALR